jgi:hypothetical protein
MHSFHGTFYPYKNQRRYLFILLTAIHSKFTGHLQSQRAMNVSIYISHLFGDVQPELGFPQEAIA